MCFGLSNGLHPQYSIADALCLGSAHICGATRLEDRPINLPSKLIIIASYGAEEFEKLDSRLGKECTTSELSTKASTIWR